MRSGTHQCSSWEGKRRSPKEKNGEAQNERGVERKKKIRDKGPRKFGGRRVCNWEVLGSVKKKSLGPRTRCLKDLSSAEVPQTIGGEGVEGAEGPAKHKKKPKMDGNPR